MADRAAEKGWDVIFTDPGTVEQINCPVCLAPMSVELDQNIPASWAEAVSGKKHRCDVWRCSSYTCDWHTQVKHLRQEMDNTASPTLCGILQMI